MNPTKCPNCRLSLPQNWSGANDPAAKCPYCGKSVAGGSVSATGPTVPPSAPPAHAPKAAAKTILWGAGMAIPGRPSPTPPIAPPGSPAVPTQPVGSSTRPPLGDAPTAHRNVVPDPAASARPAPVIPVAPAAAAGEIDVDVSEGPSPEPPAASAPASKPNQPAPTVMFEPGGAHSNLGMSNLDKPLAAAELAAPADVPEEVELPEESSGAKPISRTKQKGKQGPRKLYKPKSGLASRREEEEEDISKASSSKLGLIIFLSLVAVGALVIGIVLLRGKGKSEDGKDHESPVAQEPAKSGAESAPIEKPAALAPTPTAVPPTPKLAKPEPAKAEKPSAPTRPEAPRPVAAERPTTGERPRPGPGSASAEPKAEGGKANEENRRRASEAYKRGNTNLFAGKTTEAIAEFSLAVKLNPKDPVNHRGLGLAYAQAGKTSDAIRHLKLYLRGAPKANDRAMIEKRLTQLRGQ